MKLKKILIILTLFGIISCLVVTVKFIYYWKSPAVNYNAQLDTHNCIYSGTYNKANISSMNQFFDVHYVENSNKYCINPYFPVVRITTKSNHNAWLHIVYTDSKALNLRQSIDAPDLTKYPFIYPFYTLHQDFYDDPLWSYTLFSKPLNFWEGHAYAVEIDHKNKTIKCIGGIKWGFRLSFFHLRPQMIAPGSLRQQDWKNDWQFFKKELKEYKNL